MKSTLVTLAAATTFVNGMYHRHLVAKSCEEMGYQPILDENRCVEAVTQLGVLVVKDDPDQVNIKGRHHSGERPPGCFEYTYHNIAPSKIEFNSKRDSKFTSDEWKDLYVICAEDTTEELDLEIIGECTPAMGTTCLDWAGDWLGLMTQAECLDHCPNGFIQATYGDMNCKCVYGNNPRGCTQQSDSVYGQCIYVPHVPAVPEDPASRDLMLLGECLPNLGADCPESGDWLGEGASLAECQELCPGGFVHASYGDWNCKCITSELPRACNIETDEIFGLCTYVPNFVAACDGERKYTLTFQADWNQEDFPLNYPEDPHFSDLQFIRHDGSFELFEVGKLASPEVQQVAETGYGTKLEELIGEGDIQNSEVKFDPLGTYSVSIVVTEKKHYVSGVAMVAPSSDFFMGFSKIDLCDHATGEWKDSIVMDDIAVYDAGTDNGDCHECADDPADPHKPIKRIMPSSGNFCDTCSRIDLGKIVIEDDGIPEPEPECVFCAQAIPQCEEGCRNCKITEKTCTECSMAVCMDAEPEPECVFCTQAIPQCEEGCRNCKITEQTCTECSMAVCMDAEPEPEPECVICSQAIPQCEEGCTQCQITEQTCNECSMAICIDGVPPIGAPTPMNGCSVFKKEGPCNNIGGPKGCMWGPDGCFREDRCSIFKKEAPCNNLGAKMGCQWGDDGCSKTIQEMPAPAGAGQGAGSA